MNDHEFARYLDNMPPSQRPARPSLAARLWARFRRWRRERRIARAKREAMTRLMREEWKPCSWYKDAGR